MKEFFGFGGYQRTPEGFLSWQHLVFVSAATVIMICLAAYLGLKRRHSDHKTKNKVIAVTAIVFDVLEISRIVFLCFRNENPWDWLHNLPLFLCTISLIALPLAAFSSGRLQEAALDFAFIFGMLGGILGNYGAGQNYNAYPVISFDNVSSCIMHSITGFASFYIAFAGMASMKKKNIWLTFCILFGFCGAAYIANITIPYNYMFLMRGDGTPYDIFYNLVNGSPVLYPLTVVGLFVLYIVVFYTVFYMIRKRKEKRQNEKS
ncbi:MAG: YwaF family protein [Clostridia bacterium]|nr:YwaF family protein [Clostridia bacterium]MBQ3869862.1 YwaF family protein [Clostridia bacterium]